MCRVVIAFVCWVVVVSVSPAFGVQAPVWTDEAGAPRSLADLRGDVVVVNFWATWCVPCVEELPRLQGIQDRYADRGVRVVGVAVDDPAERDHVYAFARSRGVRFEVLTGGTTVHMRALGLGDVLPATAVLDANGAVVTRLRGVATRRELNRAVRDALQVEALATGEHSHGPAAEPGTAQAGEPAEGAKVSEASLVPS